MEILEFMSSDYGSGSGYGSSYSCGYGYGYGSGYGSGDGSGDGFGYGSGSGDGSGDGYGYDYGSDYGNGDGFGDGIKSINGMTVYKIDDLPTVITRISHGIAKGFILRDDLSLTPCYIVKQDGYFAHGETLRAAHDALVNKLFEDMGEDERIAAFVEAHEADKVYSDKDFFEWHNRLTGSCEMGRMEFARRHGLEKLDGSRTVLEFIELCKDSYGGEIIERLKEYYEVKK